jgi:two-component sensor histidine kinase
LHKRAAGTGEIRVELRHDTGNTIKLTVGDNGLGLPEGFEVQNCESLGLKLVSVLASQLKGAIHLNTNSGTEIVITFELRKNK